MPIVALTTEDATLIAAVIAAAAGLLKLGIDAIVSLGAETRAAHREILAPHLGEIATGIHQVVAGAVLVHTRAKQGQAPGEADTKAGKAGTEALKRQRLEVRYSLAGANEALRTLSRAYDWASTFKGDASGDTFIEAVRTLGRVVDDAIARSYSRGRPPTYWERRRLDRTAKSVRAAWESRFGRKQLESEEGV